LPGVCQRSGGRRPGSFAPSRAITSASGARTSCAARKKGQSLRGRGGVERCRKRERKPQRHFISR